MGGFAFHPGTWPKTSAQKLSPHPTLTSLSVIKQNNGPLLITGCVLFNVLDLFISCREKPIPL